MIVKTISEFGALTLSEFKRICNELVTSKYFDGYIKISVLSNKSLNSNTEGYFKIAKIYNIPLIYESGSNILGINIDKLRLISEYHLVPENCDNKLFSLIDELNRWNINTHLRYYINEENLHLFRDYITLAIRNSLTLDISFDSLKFAKENYNYIYHILSQYHLNFRINKIITDNDPELCINESGEIQYKNCENRNKEEKLEFEYELQYDKRLDYYHDTHKNKRCFILGNGPSLTKELVQYLKNEITIGCNEITVAKRLWDFTPSYFAFADWRFVSDEKCLKEFHFAINELKCPKFFLEHVFYQEASEASGRRFNNPFISETNRKLIREHFIPINTLNPILKLRGLMMEHKRNISFDLRKGTIMSGTVVQDTLIPIAAWLGCNPIYLVGCDCNNEGWFFKKVKTEWQVGKDVIVQYGWLQERLMEEGKMLYNLSTSNLPNIQNVTIDAVFGASQCNK